VPPAKCRAPSNHPTDEDLLTAAGHDAHFEIAHFTDHIEPELLHLRFSGLERPPD
jgi:hypothetical protein